VENDDAPGVLPGVEFLRDVNLGTGAAVGDKVVVVGGGSVAMDAARSALRLQAIEGRTRDVTLVYRRSRDEMPAYSWEILEGAEEGLHFEYLAAPARVELDPDGRVAGLRNVRMELGEPDESGRRRPIPIAGSEFVVECDTIIPAVGLSVDLTWLSDELAVSSRGTIAADRFDFTTTHPKVFAGGDAVRGPATLIDAIGDGQRAAFAIERLLTGISGREAYLEQMQRSRRIVRAVRVEDLEEAVPRAEATLEPADERVGTFAEVVHALTADQAVCEAGRCLRCDLER
jgi:NADPH-dependent glutamate synthase beta subunit-like oxidoreductase